MAGAYRALDQLRASGDIGAIGLGVNDAQPVLEALDQAAGTASCSWAVHAPRTGAHRDAAARSPGTRCVDRRRRPVQFRRPGFAAKPSGTTSPLRFQSSSASASSTRSAGVTGAAPCRGAEISAGSSGRIERYTGRTLDGGVTADRRIVGTTLSRFPLERLKAAKLVTVCPPVPE